MNNTPDYSKKENWTVEMLEQTLMNHTVLKADEMGDFEKLWMAKLDCEETIGVTIQPHRKENNPCQHQTNH